MLGSPGGRGVLELASGMSHRDLPLEAEFFSTKEEMSYLQIYNTELGQGKQGSAEDQEEFRQLCPSMEKVLPPKKSP